MRSTAKPNPAAVRDWLFLMMALAISAAGITAYALFNSIVAPPAQHEVLTDRSPDPIAAGQVGSRPVLRSGNNP